MADLNEDALKEALDEGLNEPLNETPAEPVKEEEFTVDHWKESQEHQARSSGWKPLEEFVADGKDPENWVSPEVYNERGRFLRQIKNQKREFERTLDEKVGERVQGVKKLYEARIADLNALKHSAIEDGNVETVRQIDEQIDDLRQNTPVHNPYIPPQLHPAEEAWNAQNPWINEAGPKTEYAQLRYQDYRSRNISVEDALKAVDRDVEAKFPNKQTKIPPSEKGSGSGGFNRKKSNSVSSNDLTMEEKSLWKNAPELWDNDENAFLKAVADARGAE